MCRSQQTLTGDQTGAAAKTALRPQWFLLLPKLFLNNQIPPSLCGVFFRGPRRRQGGGGGRRSPGEEQWPCDTRPLSRACTSARHTTQQTQGGEPRKESDKTHDKEQSHSYGSLQIGFSIPAPILWVSLTHFSPGLKFSFGRYIQLVYSSQDPLSFSRKSRSSRQLHIPHNMDKICCLIRHWHVYYNLYRRVTCAEESSFFFWCLCKILTQSHERVRNNQFQYLQRV